MIALVLGGAPSVWDDAAAAKRLLGNRPYAVVAANLAIVEYRGRLDAAATLHPDLMAGWLKKRRGNADFRAFAPTAHPGITDLVPERWSGSSGLYAAQCALTELGAAGVILCGVPMNPEQGHITHPGPWTGGTGYRRAFANALPIIGARVRSMGGWTAALFGIPSEPWIAAVHVAKPLGSTAPQKRTSPMLHTVKNTTSTERRFNERDPKGGFRLVRLAPGESGDFDIDPAQARFQTGELKVTPKGAAKAKAKAPARNDAKPRAAKPKAAAHPAVRPAPVFMSSNED